jgi:myo-inositol-1(or 4)-monophosphatase
VCLHAQRNVATTVQIGINNDIDIDIAAAGALAQQLADSARTIALRWFRQPLAVEAKADDSPVTQADREIETCMRGMIGAAFPQHAILGEEFGFAQGASFTWVLDPIDGTRSFITGSPLWGTLIALLHGDRPLLGLIDIPATGERWFALAGAECTLNGRPARSSGCARLDDARVYTTSPDTFAERADWERFERLSRQAAMRRFGGDCYSYGLLASGHCDLVVEAGLQPYDYLAMVAIIEAAGGRISDWRGAPLTVASDGRVVAAASETLWREALAALA